MGIRFQHINFAGHINILSVALCSWAPPNLCPLIYKIHSFHVSSLQILTIFQHQLKNLKSKVSSKLDMNETQDTFILRQLFSSWDSPRSNKLCSSKVQWWDSRGKDIPIPEGRKKKGVIGLEQAQNLPHHSTLIIIAYLVVSLSSLPWKQGLFLVHHYIVNGEHDF